ncbi:MAG TPA: hypothetical protein VMT00_14860 [Thermoanaerobaculia bacterium]|nr:hypothetical protein [Thermoanaerobaculia bacterium]
MTFDDARASVDQDRNGNGSSIMTTARERMEHVVAACDAILAEEMAEVPSEARQRLESRFAMLVEEQVARERERLAMICRERAVLWERTLLATSALPSAVAEARSRSNEAKYLADLFESDADLAEIDA